MPAIAHTYADPTRAESINVASAVLRRALPLVSMERGSIAIAHAGDCLDRYARGFLDKATAVNRLEILADTYPSMADDAPHVVPAIESVALIIQA